MLHLVMCLLAICDVLVCLSYSVLDSTAIVTILVMQENCKYQPVIMFTINVFTSHSVVMDSSKMFLYEYLYIFM